MHFPGKWKSKSLTTDAKGISFHYLVAPLVLMKWRVKDAFPIFQVLESIVGEFSMRQEEPRMIPKEIGLFWLAIGKSFTLLLGKASN